MKQLAGRLLLLGIAVSFAAACDRTQRAATPTPAPTAPVTTAQAAAERPRPQALSLRNPAAETPQPRVAPDASPPSPPQDTPSTGADLLETDRPAAIAPRDFRIGPLWVSQSGQTDAQVVLATFLSRLVRGEVAVDLLEDADRDRLVRSLEYYEGSRPQRFRIGALQEAPDGGILANVRLFGSPGVAEGEIYLVRTEAGWRVADLQVAFSMLDQAYAPPAEPFVPSTFEYRRDDNAGGE